jgi:hypothetical protein
MGLLDPANAAGCVTTQHSATPSLARLAAMPLT